MTAEIFNFKTWISETAPKMLVTRFDDLLKQSGFTILTFTDHPFEPQGFTAVWVLAESHLAIHTFPEAGKTYVELSSCNRGKNERFQKLLSENFKMV